MAAFNTLIQSFRRGARRRLAPLFTAVAIVAAGCHTVRPAPYEPPSPPERTPVVDNAPPAPPKPPETKPKPRNRGYTVTDLLERNIGAVPPANDNLTERERLQYYLTQLCFEIGDKDTKTLSNEEIRVTLGEIGQLTLMGRPLVQVADDMNIKFCGLKDLPAGVAALYYPSADTIITSPARNKYDLLMQLTHEMMHAAQDHGGLMWYSPTWGVESRVHRNLTIEASAATAEMLIAYESRLRGNNDYWAYLNLGWGGASMDKTSLKLLDDTYRAAIKGGSDHTGALMQAGRATFENTFNNQGWRNFYLNQELTLYVQDIALGVTNARTPLFLLGDGFDQSSIDRAGQIGFGAASFTQGACIPSLKDLLKDNPAMGWAYEAAEIWRLKKAFSPQSVEYAEAFNAAVAGNNPYLGLDLGRALALHNAATWRDDGGKSYRYLYQHLDDMLGKGPRAPQAPIWVGPMMASGGEIGADDSAAATPHRHAPGCGCRARPPAP
jgi:hypothetical protein